MFRLLKDTEDGNTDVMCECGRLYQVDAHPDETKCPWCGVVSSLIDGASKPVDDNWWTEPVVVGRRIDKWSQPTRRLKRRRVIHYGLDDPRGMG